MRPEPTLPGSMTSSNRSQLVRTPSSSQPQPALFLHATRRGVRVVGLTEPGERTERGLGAGMVNLLRGQLGRGATW